MLFFTEKVFNDLSN